MQAAARGQHTARAYRTAIGLFLQYLGGVLGAELASATHEGRAVKWAFAGSVAPLRHIEPGHLAGFRAWRESQGDGPNTASQRCAAVVTFLSVAYRDGIIEDRQALSMGIRPYKQRQKRDRRPVGRRLEKAEVRALQEAPDVSTAKGKRDLAILNTMLYAGLRVDEVTRLDLENLRQDRGRWWILFSGKGQKSRRVKVHDVLFESLTSWLALRKLEPGKDKGPIFVNVNKGDNIGANALNTASINRMVAELGARAELAPASGENRLSPHDLRRTCARNAFDNGAPLPLIEAMLGHASVDTTMTYIGASDDEGGGAVDFVRY
jgi:integrase